MIRKTFIAVMIAVTAALGTVALTGAPAQAGCVFHDMRNC